MPLTRADEGAGDVLILSYAIVIWSLAPHPYKAGTEIAFAGPGSLSIKCRDALTSRIESELYPAEIFRPEAGGEG